MSILLTGATGTVGSELARQLLERGTQIRVVTRDPEAATSGLAKSNGVEVVRGDFNEPDSMRSAREGIERTFLLTPSTERSEAWQTSFIQLVAEAGVRPLVLLSQLHADAYSSQRFLKYHGVAEEAAREAGLTHTVLCPNLYMQGLLGFRQPIAEEGILPLAGGAAEVSAVDVRDVAEVAAEALTTHAHDDQTYALTGPEALSFEDMARVLSEVTGREVQYVEVSAEAMRAALLQMGMPPWQADGLVEEFAMYRREAASESEDGDRGRARRLRSRRRAAHRAVHLSGDSSEAEPVRPESTQRPARRTLNAYRTTGRGASGDGCGRGWPSQAQVLLAGVVGQTFACRARDADRRAPR